MRKQGGTEAKQKGQTSHIFTILPINLRDFFLSQCIPTSYVQFVPSKI